MRRFIMLMTIAVLATIIFKVVPKLNQWVMKDPTTTFGRLDALEQRVIALEGRGRN